MDWDDLKILLYAIVISLIVGGIVLTYVFSRKVGSQERIVIYRLGKTRRHLIKYSGERAVALPFIHRVVHVTGELRDAWGDVHKVLPLTWWVSAPERDDWSGDWSVRGGAPTGASDRREAEGSGGSPAEALLALAARIPEVLRERPDDDSSDGEQVFGSAAPPVWRRYLRNPYRLPIHGNHFFLLPESWYDERGPTGRYSYNGRIGTIDFIAALMPPFVVALLLRFVIG